MLATDVLTKTNDLNLGLESTLQELLLWVVDIEIYRSGNELVKLFEQEPLLPGIILTEDQRYVGMISRRKLFEKMSSRYSLELYSQRPIEILYKMLKPGVFVLSEDTSVIAATQMALERASELVYEPILVETESGKHKIVDFQQLLLAYSQIHVLTLAQLQHAEEKSKKAETGLRDLQHNYTQLVQNEKMVALGQLVAGVAHEINNPVNFIAGNLTYAIRYGQELLHLISLYQQHYLDPPVEIQTALEQIELDFLTVDFPKLLASMQIGTERIQEIVGSLRNFSRLDEAEKKAVDIHEGIDSTLLILRSRLNPCSKNEKDITIVKEYGNFPLIECYAGQLNQVFMNILSNAIDALKEEIDKSQLSTPTIWIRTLMPDPTYLVIRIADNGVGMTEEVKQQICDPFFTTKPVGKGTGLGLSISYQIVVEKHGGQLRCISARGEGTEFIIEIPCSQV